MVRHQLFSFALALLVVPFLATAVEAGEFTWNSTIRVAHDKTLDVVDSLTRSGVEKGDPPLVLRIPNEYTNVDKDHFHTLIDLKDVTDNSGVPVRYRQKQSKDALKITVDPPSEASTKKELRYNFHYVVKGAVRPCKGGQQVCWQQIGADNSRLVNSAEALVYLPDGVDLIPIESASFRGPDYVQFGQSFKAADGLAFHADNIAPGHAWVIDVRSPVTFLRGIIPSYTPPSIFRPLLFDFFAHWQLWLPVLIASAAIYLLMWRPSDEEARAASTAEWLPPSTVTGAELRTVVHGSCDARAVVSDIVSLAVKGAIAVRQSGDSYELIAKTSEGANLSEHERILLNALFNGANSISLEQLTLRNKDLRGLVCSAVADKAVADKFMPRADSSMFLSSLQLGACLVLASGALLLAHQLQAAIGIGLSGIIVLSCANWLPDATVAGSKLKGRARRFLETVQSGAVGESFNDADVFNAFLPHAVAMECEHRWFALAEDAKRVDWMEQAGDERADPTKAIDALHRAFQPSST